MDLTFVRTEDRKPFPFPGYKFCEVCLQDLTVCLMRDCEIHDDIAFYNFKHVANIHKEKSWA